ncbi:hypothetical protein SALBM311S_04330 [Streptomyces alboniger]
MLFLADSPTTGGYPVIGVVPEPGLSAAAQAPPGLPVRFVPLRNPADRRPTVKARADGLTKVSPGDVERRG